MGRLFGLPAAAPSKARVLEVGCANGANLLPMAEQYPESHFVGIDNSAAQVAEAKRAIEAVGLKNVEVRQQDILEFPASAGKFDYIVAHGVLSWVPAPVRQKLFAICQQHLSDAGIAYISYNALPGWNMRRSLRDMMLYHTSVFSDPKTKVQQAKALLGFLSDSVPTDNNPYGLHLKSELETFRRAADNYLRHEFLEEDNAAFYFHEFMAMAQQHGLQYVGEPGIAQMLTGNFPEKVRETLEKLSGQIVRQEQYMDFLRNRIFRQTLLCRREIGLQRNITPASLTKFAFRSILQPPETPVDLSPGVPAVFPASNGMKLNTSDAFVKALFLTLAESNGASAISYQSLLDTARLRSRPVMGPVLLARDQVDEDTLGANLVSLLARGVVELLAEPVTISVRVPEKPLVSSLARYQAANGLYVTNRMHQSVPTDAVARYVLEFSDGSRTRDEILGALVTYVKLDKMAVKEGEQRITDVHRLQAVLGPQVDQVLRNVAAMGFFAP